MGIWDSVKSRFGLGVANGETDRGYYGYEDSDYDNQDYDVGYEDDEEAYEDDQPAAMRTFGVDRADYYNDNHSPLVTQSDVRSQPVPISSQVGQARDRIPAPQPYRRGTVLPSITADEDELAFKGGLARTQGSLSQLQAERLRMEDTGKIKAIDARINSQTPLDSSRQAGASQDLNRLGNVLDASRRFGNGQVHQRVHRRIEHIRPVSYADAEQVSQALKRGVVVVLDLKATRPDLAKRILDFAFGTASALDGQVDRFIDRVYIFTRNGPLTEEEQASIRV
jgi:cell division inhibitor SepF